MEKTIFDIAGKQLPYVMPNDFNPSRLMADAISLEEKRSKRGVIRKIMWLSSSVAAAAVALIVVIFQPATANADPTYEYHAALTQYCNNASNAEMEKRIDMAESDYVANIDNYEEYYLY